MLIINPLNAFIVLEEYRGNKEIDMYYIHHFNTSIEMYSTLL